MRLEDMPIRRKLMTGFLLTSGVVLLLTCAVFAIYEIVTLRKGMLERYTTRANIIAASSSAALAFRNEADATEMLGFLKADTRIVGACLYDDKGKLFAKYPADAPADLFPPLPVPSGYRGDGLDISCPVAQGDRVLGTAYIRCNLSALSERYRTYSWFTLVIMAGSILVAFFLSRTLQKQLSLPILALAGTAKAISARGDFSIRAEKFGRDELGELTDTFNRMLDQLQQTELRLSTVIQNAPLILYSLDPKGVVTLSTGKGLEDIGLKPGGSTGKSVFEVYPANSSILEKVKKALAGEEAHGLVEVNGHTVEALYKPIKDAQGRVTEVVGVAIDVTARQKAEKSLKEVTENQNFITSILENVPNMIFVKDAKDLRFVMFNKAGEELLGVPRADLIGKNDYDLFPSKDADFFTAKDRKTLESGKLLDIPEEPLQTMNKGLRTLHTKKFPVFGTDGKPQYLLGISEDITEQKEQESLRIYAKALENSNQELQDFIFVASHDLQEPLRKIQSFGNFLKEEAGPGLSPSSADYLQRMQDAARRMGVLLEDLLQLTRVTTRAQPFAPVDLSEVAKEVISDLEMRIKETNGKVEMSGLPSLEADASQMRQLFQNLIGNALKFRRAGIAPVVEVKGSVERDNRLCRIQVRDNGIGFDQKYADKVFNIFQRLNGQEYEGTGIGLAICRKVVERHGGKIKASSKMGEGAVFEITLPLHQIRKGERS